MRRLMTVKELCELTGLARQTIYNKLQAIERGDSNSTMPRPIRIGRRLRFDRDEVEAWLASGGDPKKPMK